MTDHQAGGTTTVVTAEEIENVLITSAGAAPDVFEGSRHVPWRSSASTRWPCSSWRR